MTKIVLHDYFSSAEGGGRLSSLLAQSSQADLAYGFSKPNHPFVQGAKKNIHEHDLQAYSRIPLWQQFKLARAFQNQTHFLSHYNVAVYSGFYAPLAICNHFEGKNILYCHTPPRFIYDKKDFYLSSIPYFSRPLLHSFIHYLQPRYEAAVKQMDVIIANSKNIQQRIKTYLGLESQIVYPPCETKNFSWQGQDNYYLSFARLDPLKRVDKIIQAFIKMPQQNLIVTSGGTELNRLKRLAANSANIQFTGWLEDQALYQLIGKSIATLYLAKDEDFGMSPVESMAAGKPVIAVAEGGLQETVLDGQTGYLLDADFDLEDIVSSVEKLTPKKALEMRPACEQRAKIFAKEIFIEQMNEKCWK